MKKLLVIGGIVFGLGVIGFIVGSFFLGSIVTAGVNRFAPGITQTKVTLAGAHISPLSGRGTLSGLVVGNPKGWSDTPLCSLRKVHVDVAPFSIFGDHIVVNEVFIDAPEFNYETKFVSSNVNDLLKNIEAAIGGKDAAAQPTARNGKPVKLEVKHFRLQDGRVRLGLNATVIPLPMPPIELHDLGTKEGGITPDQLAFAVMRSVTNSIVSATIQAAGQIGTTGGAASAESVKKTVESIKGLFGGKKGP